MRRKRFIKSDDIHIDMTPMLDIVFIMLIFFVLTSSFASHKQLKIDPPMAASGQAIVKPPVIVTIDAQDQILWQERSVSLAQLSGLLLQELARNPNLELLVEADKMSHQGVVVEVMDMAQSLGVKKFAVTVEQRRG